VSRGVRPLGLAILLLLGVAAARPAAAEPLIADLSNHLIAITTGFSGTEVLMFGATDGPGDIVVTVRGPATDVAVRRKARVFGVWINADTLEFGSVPAYYAIASNRPIDDFLLPPLQARQRIGLDNLMLSLPEADPAEVETFRRALIRTKQQQGLFGSVVGKVSFLGNQLFRTELHFPSNVPIGSYLVEVLLIREGAVVSAQTTPLVISKIGIGAEIFRFAHIHSFGYGVGAILGALLLGWIAYLGFRRL
jgi:uncharacterized protein (TIGR02186 family)